ncbi:hypothetical protein FRC07_004331 [Ceratobasidium sp. 392]|nr:hypothetical protein FRC07_004331 [Ceratobasidium sp. 392]
MSHPLYWSSKTHFYPIGNTPPVCLTQDLSPEQSADILLLGCGDPRHILFTLYADLTVSSTRNVVLLTLLADNESVDRVWDIFYHFQIDDSALSTLVRHCQHLVTVSSSPAAWQASSYGSFLKFLDARTLHELRRHWILYAAFPKLSKSTLNKFWEQKNQIISSKLKSRDVVTIASLLASRSAGPLFQKALVPVSKELINYWKTGTMDHRPEDVKKANHLNPMFVYSLSGEMLNIHHGTFPHGFHLAPTFTPIASKGVVFTRMQQFKTYVQAFQDSRRENAVSMWLYAGDALAFCHALRRRSRSGLLATTIPITPWRAAQINFDQITSSHSPPTEFDVIDTSNLTDHLGVLNILIATQPLLKSQPVSQSVLYTESLILSGETITNSLHSRLKTDISTIGLLLGLVPRPYLSRFTTQSHTHELMILPEIHGNYRERIAWVHPASNDANFKDNGQRITFSAKDLANVLADIFRNMFPRNKLFWRQLFSKSSPVAQREENLPQYHHRSFAMLFELLQNRVTVHDADWILVAHLFLELAHKRNWFSKRIELQELALHLFRLATQSNRALKPHMQKNQSLTEFYVNVLQSFISGQSASCIVLTVPRNNLRYMLENPGLFGSVMLQCKMVYHGYFSTYTSIHAAWGRCVTSKNPVSVTIQEDPAGKDGTSGLVVTFWVASNILEHKDATVILSFKPTPIALVSLSPILGAGLEVFSVKVHTSRHVQVLPYRPSVVGQPRQTWFSQFEHPVALSPAASEVLIRGAVTSGWKTPSQITSLVATADAKLSGTVANLKQDTHMAQVHQVTPCTMDVSIRGQQYRVSYPYPVQGNSYQLRQKGSKWEMSVPIAEPLRFSGYNLEWFPLLRNIHYINLDRMPIINTSDPRTLGWLPTHIDMQLSAQERAWTDATTGHSKVQNCSRLTGLPCLDSSVSKTDTLPPLIEVKQSISKIVLGYSGLSGPPKRLFWLKGASSDPYACILLRYLRLDLTSSTVVLDSAAIWLSNNKMARLRADHMNLAGDHDVIITTSTEASAWRSLLLAFAERCRTWTHHPECGCLSRKTPSVEVGSIESKTDPFCECGKGLGLGPSLQKVPEQKEILAHSTRIAISPLFSVPYLGKILDSKQARSLLDVQNKEFLGTLLAQKRGYSTVSQRVDSSPSHHYALRFPRMNDHMPRPPFGCFSRMRLHRLGFLM